MQYNMQHTLGSFIDLACCVLWNPLEPLQKMKPWNMSYHAFAMEFFGETHPLGHVSILASSRSNMWPQRTYLMIRNTNDQPEDTPPSGETGQSQEMAQPQRRIGKSRAGKAHIGAYLDMNFRRSLRMVQAQTDKDMQQLIADALNDLFRKYNVPVVDEE
jgi:hypothetical protein